MKNDYMVMSPLPKIFIQNGGYQLNNKITQMIKKLNKQRQMEILEERSQGFWMQDEVKISLDRIKTRSQRIKTMPLVSNSLFSIRNQNSKRHQSYNKYDVEQEKNKQHSYLPQLNEMIQTRETQNNSLIRAKRRKIIHLIILGLNRRNLGKLYEALDIILLASFYFEKDDEERKLKTICLNLISKLHKEIKAQKLSLARKSKLIRKRKSLTILNFLSRQNFMENFIMKLRKTKLVGEFSYSELLKTQKQTYKINAKCQVFVPKPSQIFVNEPDIQNFETVVITVDEYTNMFPYQYPKSLSEKIEQRQFRQIICKLNGLLFPQSKCYSFQSILKIFFIPFILIFLLILSFTLVRTFITNDSLRISLAFSILVCIITLGIKISKEESGYTNEIEIKDKMQAYLKQWEQFYSDVQLKFRMGESIDAIFIVYPSDVPDPSSESTPLTQIRQEEESFRERHSRRLNQGEVQKKELDIKSSKSMRREGSRFEENNIMKKKKQNYSIKINTIQSTSSIESKKISEKINKKIVFTQEISQTNSVSLKSIESKKDSDVQQYKKQTEDDIDVIRVSWKGNNDESRRKYKEKDRQQERALQLVQEKNEKEQMREKDQQKNQQGLKFSKTGILKSSEKNTMGNSSLGKKLKCVNIEERVEKEKDGIYRKE